MGRAKTLWIALLLAASGCDAGAGDDAPPQVDMASGAAPADADAPDIEPDGAVVDGAVVDAVVDGAAPMCGDGPPCVDPEVCRDGRCAPPDGCVMDTDCDDGAICRDGRCLRSGCRVDADCPDALVCRAQRCVDPPECGPDTPCPGAALCRDGACVEPGCVDDVECPDGTICRDGACGAPDCLDDAGCPVGEVCAAGACEPAACAADVDCPPGELCEDGRCVPDPGPQACIDPRPMPAFGVYRGTTRGAADEVGARCADGADAPEVALRFELDRDADVCLSTMGSAYDSVLHVRTACADPASEVVCRDDGFGRDPFQAQVRVMAAAGVTYFVFVDGFRGDAGDWVLEFVDGPCPAMPPPSECVVDDDCGASGRCEAGVCVPVMPGR